MAACRRVVVALLALAALPVAPLAQAEQSAGVHATAWSNGVELTLVVPHHFYPRNALIRVHVRLRNDSGRSVQVPYFQFGCGRETIAGVDVLDDAGHVIYPPTFVGPAMPPTHCKHLPPVSLPSGQSRTDAVYVVLRGSRLRAQVTLTTAALTTPDVRVQLRTEPAPEVQIHAAGDRAVHAVVSALHGVHTQLFATGWATCSSPYSLEVAVVPDWTLVLSSTLAPGCSPVSQWHLAVAWLGHPVAFLEYPGAHPAPHTMDLPGVLTVRQVHAYCRLHAHRHVHAVVRGFMTAVVTNGPPPSRIPAALFDAATTIAPSAAPWFGGLSVMITHYHNGLPIFDMRWVIARGTLRCNGRFSELRAPAANLHESTGG